METAKAIVSVITPTYNCAGFIGQTIESVQAQDYPYWEMIIVDDCSTDQTKDIVARYCQADPRIRYYCLDHNSGAARARTEAMELAQGDYMAFLDSDDLWTPDKLSRQLAFMQKTGAAFSCTAYEQIEEDGRKNGKIIRALPRCNYNRLLLDCPVGNSTVMYDVKAMGKFEVPDIRKRNDDALWLQMLKKEPYIYGMTDVLMLYRLRSGSISSNKWKLVRYHWQLYREIEHLSVPRSLFHIGYWGFLKAFHLK
ncbi:glycosyltransferase family 2 protein [Oscillospiraceae bacterium HV4-5-C5C]|nr:glycosyltransferase family 2 protein [Oscillospiraceae bacterium HV4-5-C5C]